jgi:hypothetical protein
MDWKTWAANLSDVVRIRGSALEHSYYELRVFCRSEFIRGAAFGQIAPYAQMVGRINSALQRIWQFVDEN